MKSPIKDLRHNSKSLDFLKKIIPPHSNIQSFLLFAGDLEINLAEDQRHVSAHTNKFVVYDFWDSLFEDPSVLASMADFFFPFESEEIFNVFQKEYNRMKDPYVRSALFFLLNRCSSNGMISSGKLEQKNYSPMALSYIKRFKQTNFEIIYDNCEDFLTAVAEASDTDFILLPVGKFSFNLLEEGINRGPEETAIYHKDLKKTVDSLDTKVILLYKYHIGALKLYKDYNIAMLDEYGRKTSDKEKAQELVIANFRIN